MRPAVPSILLFILAVTGRTAPTPWTDVDGSRCTKVVEVMKDRWSYGISHLDDDVVPLKLKAGKKHLLLKIQNKADKWSFVGRLHYRDR